MCYPRNNNLRYRLESYARGVNDFVDSLTWWPIEFYLLWVPKFEPWTVEDSLGIQVLMQYMVSFDWFLELTRQRLTEIYDKELVDRMLPFRRQDYFYKET
jgi:acyl-homoserine lactone acylase PvdQ